MQNLAAPVTDELRNRPEAVRAIAQTFIDEGYTSAELRATSGQVNPALAEAIAEAMTEIEAGTVKIYGAFAALVAVTFHMHLHFWLSGAWRFVPVPVLICSVLGAVAAVMLAAIVRILLRDGIGVLPRPCYQRAYA